jgi:hypothetical protein
MTTSLLLASLLLFAPVVHAQQFGGEQVITTSAGGAQSVYATDLDGDGDADVLSASYFGSEIAWYENLGNGSFHSGRSITTSASYARSVYATDLDGDGDADVLSASYFGSEIAWYENLGNGSFHSGRAITTSVSMAHSVYATDLDGDGDADVLSASAFDYKIAWYENLGSGSFHSGRIITTSADSARSVYATDLDGDGDADVLSASLLDNKIAWYENLGNGSFHSGRIITTSAHDARWVYAMDLDGDGDADVLSASFNDDKIAWYENLGNGSFHSGRAITTNADGAKSVYATDLDGDGDADVLSASWNNDKIAWYENLGNGSFHSGRTITTNADGARSVYATDLDGDGDADVLSASAHDNKVAWYENLLLDPDADQDGLSNIVEAGLGTDPLDQDSDDDGLSDGEEVNTSRPDTRWLQGPNGHYYRLAPAKTWSQASASARAQGYELTSVQDEAEAIWLSDTFGDVGDGFWIGLTDFNGTFQWSDGSTSTYRRWATGEPNTSFVAAWVGGPSSAEPSYWFADPAGATPRLAVWESPGPDAPTTALDPLAFDTDGDGLGDGQEDGLDAIVWDGSGIPGVSGTDPLVFVPDADPLTTTDPLDLDSDEDGIEDGAEDLDGDGARSAGETDAASADSDGDGLPDGLELGLTAGTLDTNGAVFIPDADPLTTTDPLAADTDLGGVYDGIEDHNRDGAVNTWETDPNDGGDETLAFYVSNLHPGQKVHFEVYGALPRTTIVPAYSVRGPGPTALSIGITVNLTPPITALPPLLSGSDGRASWDGPPVPTTVPIGTSVWFQLVEVPLGTMAPRASNAILLPVGSH